MKKVLIKVLSITVVIAITVGVSSYLVLTKKEFKPSKAKEDVRYISAIKTQRQSHTPIQNLYGQLHTELLTKIVAPISAEVEQVNIASGKLVKQGQLLISLSKQKLTSSVAKYELKIAQTQLEIVQTKANLKDQKALLVYDKQLLKLKQKNLDRIKKLTQLQNRSAKELETAMEANLNRQIAVLNRNKQIIDLGLNLQKLNSRLEAEKVDLADANLNLQDAEIYAPITGLALSVKVQPGSRIGVNGLVAEILPLDRVEFEAVLVNRQLPQILASESKRLTANIQLLGQTYPTYLDRLKGMPKGSGQVGIFVAEGLPQQLLAIIRPKLIVPMQLNLPVQPQSIAVPYSAMYGTDKIFVVREGRIKSLPVNYLGSVHQGVSQLTWALIRSSEIEDGELVMTTHLPNASSGMKVTIIE